MITPGVLQQETHNLVEREIIDTQCHFWISSRELTGKAYTSAQRTLESLGWVLREECEEGENVGKSLGVGG